MALPVPPLWYPGLPVLRDHRTVTYRPPFGLTEAEYDDMLRHQGGVCAICHKPPKGRTHLPVDHNHKTGEIRGLLCILCNTALLGFIGEDPSLYRRAAEYLEISPARFAIGYRYVPGSPGAEGVPTT
jgi:hypothetical protein